MKPFRTYQQQMPSYYDDTPSSEEEEEDEKFSEEEEDDGLPDQEGHEEEEDIHQELENIEERVNKVNNTIIQNGTKKSGVANPIKVLVSKKKRRFKLEGFNLDLTYVTENIIAMGYPAEKLESFYRNSMTDVKSFFNNRHENHYRIYNLCAEDNYQYNTGHFNDNVGLFGCYDHQAPPMELIFRFCEDMKNWLSKDSKNVAAVHCKAGKGRTGVMICCYLVYSGHSKNALDALRYYGAIRTKNKKGVTIPSQIRYVYYFERAFNLGWNSSIIPRVTIAIRKIKVYTIPKFTYLGGCSPFFYIENVEGDDALVYDSRKKFPVKSYRSEAYIEYTGINEVVVTGDVLLSLFHSKVFGKKQKMCQVWFNTSFMSSSGVLTIDKSMIDKANKDRENKKFSKDFKIEIQYDIVSGEAID